MSTPVLTPLRVDASSPAAPTQPRLLGLDTARLFATLGVIWFHSIEADPLKPSGVLGRYSVGFYTLAAIIFLVQSADRRRRPFHTYALDRLRRLGIPFVGWGLITVTVKAAVAATGYPLDLPTLSPDRLVDAGTIHLWYLPFLFVASLGVYPFVLWMGKSLSRRLSIAAIALLIALALDTGRLDFIPRPTFPVVAHFFDETFGRWSAVYWGVAAAIIWTSGILTSNARIFLAVIGAAVLVAATVYQWRYGLVLQYKVYGGVGLLALSFAPWNNVIVRALAPLGRMSAGVYFAHMAAIYFARDILMFIHFPFGPGRDTLVFLAGTLLAFSTVFLFTFIPILRLLAGPDRPLPPKSPPLAGSTPAPIDSLAPPSASCSKPTK